MPASFPNIAQQFIRQGFAKSLSHGYAQSVVAATHPHVLNTNNRPSYARRNSNARLSRLQTLHLQNAFHTAATGSIAGASALPPELRGADKTNKHGSLDAYFEALQKRNAISEESAVDDVDAEAAGEPGDAVASEAQPKEDAEWMQFQFPKQIEWKPSPASVLLGSYVAPNEVDPARVPPPGPSDELALSKESLEHIDAAIEKEIAARSAQGEGRSTPVPSIAAEREIASRIDTPDIVRPHSAFSSFSLARSGSPPVDPQAEAYAGHLARLVRDERYAEIPAVFEALLVGGVRPTSAAYNALLLAAINLPTEKLEVISKALNVFADMRRRKVSPDAETYDILVGLLAARSLEVSSMRQALEEKRLRFGGMEEPGRFMFASHELDHSILAEEDRLDFAIQLFDSSVAARRTGYSAETYHRLIVACAESGRVSDMLRLFEHMESNAIAPSAATFPPMITAFAKTGDLVSAVECYNEYRSLAIAQDNGDSAALETRKDSEVYAALINAYVATDKLEGAKKFYKSIVAEYGTRSTEIKDAIISLGFVKGFLDRGIYQEALSWAQGVENELRGKTMRRLATLAADHGDKATAVAAMANIPVSDPNVVGPAMALMALHIRDGDVAAASRYWQLLANPEVRATSALIEPATMYGVALIGSGQVVEGLTESESMFQRIRASSNFQVADEVEEGVEFIARFMETRGIVDPRTITPSPVATFQSPSVSATPFVAPSTVSSYEDTFDPYAHNTDFKGSSIISDELEGAHGRKGPRMHEALNRFRNIRRAGRHPRYITYAKLISAAARDGKMDLCNEILAMARTDIPLLQEYAVCRYGWTSILDAMVGACLNAGDRARAESFHQELLSIGSTPSANTFGLYITTLKESATKTFDEASEAVRIFHRAKAEGVEPTSFLYNALIGKLGKARRIDDCLFFFAEMRAQGIRPTSVTYGTIVNALCRVSDAAFAEQLFDEMESMPNYKARPAPYNSMMQFFLTTRRDKSKVLAYYARMQQRGISPTSHTHKLLIDAHATLEPRDMAAAEAVLKGIEKPEPVHFASLIHAKGCVAHDSDGAKTLFDSVLAEGRVAPHSSLYQALCESLVAAGRVAETDAVTADMSTRGVGMTAYIANTLIHGWCGAGNVSRARQVYDSLRREGREPSTYEAMVRGYLGTGEGGMAKAREVVEEMLGRGYPGAVVGKVVELLEGGAEH